MDFTNLIFWLCLLPALLVVVLVNRVLSQHDDLRRRVHKVLLLLLSLSLLGMVSWQTLCIFVVVMHLAYGICRLGHNKSPRVQKFLLVLAIPLLLLPLAYYKYAYFISSAVMGTEWSALKNLIIPVGISFYSFQLAGFCIDTLTRGLPIPKYLDYMNFGAFFPQIVAGPIERRESLLPQMEAIDLQLKLSKVNIGLRYIMLGLFYKCIVADNIALGMLLNYSGESAWVIWFNNLIFSLRIYFDFCGYGLCAYGIATCLGINITMNFQSPYTACNISEFWRRWHVSLTTWFRDYIYIPMRGNRTKFWAFNLIFVFAISGLWHGANWNFIIWGALAGIAMVMHRLWAGTKWRLWPVVGLLLTWGCMLYIWMYFYAADIGQLAHYNSLLISPQAYSFSLANEIRTPFISVTFIGLSFAALCIFLEYISLRFRKDPYYYLCSSYFAVFIGFCLIFFKPGQHGEFIYFAF